MINNFNDLLGLIGFGLGFLVTSIVILMIKEGVTPNDILRDIKFKRL